MATIKKTFRSRYSEYEPQVYGFQTKGPSMTQQQFKEETNINNIMKKYQSTGLFTHINPKEAKFGDFTNVEDYQISLHKVMQAQEEFKMLPSELRNKFQNDPAKLLHFMETASEEDLIKYGFKDPVQSPIEKTQGGQNGTGTDSQSKDEGKSDIQSN